MKMFKKFKFKSIRTRLTFWFLALTLTPLFFVLTITYIQNRSVIEAGTSDKLTAIRDLKAVRLNYWLDEKLGDLRVASEDVEIKSLESIFDNEVRTPKDIIAINRATELLDRNLRNFNDYKEIFIVSANAGKIEISTNVAGVGNDKSHDPFFTIPLETGKIYISNIYLSNITGEPEMTISLPIKCLSHNKHIIGILVARIDLRNSLYRILSDRVGLGETGETLIINEDVVALNELRWHDNAPLNLQLSSESAINAAQGKTGITTATDYRGKEVLAAYTYLPATGWGFICKQDLYELNAPLRKMILNFIIIVLITIMVVTTITFNISRSISLPVIKLNRVAQKIGAGDFSVRNTINSEDEVGSLALEFNNMVENILKSTSLLEEKTAKLTKSQEALVSLLEDVNESRVELDISNKKLQAANKDMESFSYSVSHDLRAPLRAISGFLEILSDDYKDKLDDEAKRLINVISKNALNMNQLITDLLNFSRIGRQQVKTVKINMKNLAREIFDELRQIYPKREIKFKLGEIPSATGDSNLIRLVFTNLISNAIKFTEPRNIAEIEISSLEKDRQTLYYVKDNGVGFDMDYVDKIFGVFQRLHSSEEFEGTGVGLAIVMKIIHKHGGEVIAEGEVDKGATFYFSLSKIEHG